MCGQTCVYVYVCVSEAYFLTNNILNEFCTCCRMYYVSDSYIYSLSHHTTHAISYIHCKLSILFFHLFRYNALACVNNMMTMYAAQRCGLFLFFLKSERECAVITHFKVLFYLFCRIERMQKMNEIFGDDSIWNGI